MFWFAKLDVLVFGRCAVQKYVPLNQIQQNWMVQNFQKLKKFERDDDGRT
jgi:hypothetical protein